MTATFPLPRETRETTLLNADGVTVAYGPFAFRIFDVADVEVWTKEAGTARYEKSADVTIAKTTADALSHFTVTFGTALAADTPFIVVSRRIHERDTDATRDGSINSRELEKELSKQGTVIQELRRDLGRVVRSDYDRPGGATLASLPKGHFFKSDVDGNLIDGGDADDIINAQTYAAEAKEARDDTLTRYLGAYANDAAANAAHPARPVGAQYFNETLNQMRTWNGAEYQAANVDVPDLAVTKPKLADSLTGQIIATVPDLAGLRAAQSARDPVVLRREAVGHGIYDFVAGDLSAEVTADPDGGVYVKADDAATTLGAYVKRFYGVPHLNWFNPPQGNTGNATPMLQRAMDNYGVVKVDAIQGGFRLADPVEYRFNGQQIIGYGRHKSLLRFPQTSGNCIVNGAFGGANTVFDDCALIGCYVEAAGLVNGTIAQLFNFTNFRFNENWVYGAAKLACRGLHVGGIWPLGNYYMQCLGNYFGLCGRQIELIDGANAFTWGYNRHQPYADDGEAYALIAGGTAADRIVGFAGVGANVMEISPQHASNGMYLDTGVADFTIGPLYAENLKTAIFASGAAKRIARGGQQHFAGCLTNIANNSPSFEEICVAAGRIDGVTGTVLRGYGIASNAKAGTGIHNLAFTEARPDLNYTAIVTPEGQGYAYAPTAARSINGLQVITETVSPAGQKIDAPFSIRVFHVN